MSSASSWNQPRWYAAGATLCVVIACVPGLFLLEVDQDMSGSWINPRTPEGKAYTRYLEHFPADNGALVVVTGGLDAAQRWEALIDLSDALAALEVVDRVDGLPTAQYVRGNDAAVEVTDVLELVGTPGPELTEIVRAYEPFQDIFVSRDGAVALYVRAMRDITPQSFAPPVRDVIAAHRDRFREVPGGDLFLTGEMYLNWELARLTQRSNMFIAASILVMLVVAGITAQSMLVGLSAAATGAFSAVVTFSTMGYSGIAMTPINSIIVFMLVPLGAAAAIHAAAYMADASRLRWGFLPEDAVGPLAFAAITTALAFGATAISEYTDVVQFGLLGMFGIAVSFLVTVTFVFPILTLRHRGLQQDSHKTIPRLLELALRLPRGVAVIVLLALVAVSIFGMTRIVTAFGPSDYLQDDNTVLGDFNRAGAHFGRYPAPLVIYTGTENGALDPALWEKLKTFVDEVEREFPGLRAAWPYDYLSQLSLAYTANQPDPVAFPDSADLMAQYLLLFNERDIESYLNWDRSSLTLMFQMPFRNSESFRPFRDRVNTFLAEHNLDGRLTGRMPVFFESADKVSLSNLESILIGGGAIFALLLVVVRSFSVALIALAVNVLPIVGTLAFLGVFGVYLDVPMSFAAAIALGLVVDDTGHMVARYNMLRQTGQSPDDAARNTVRMCWRPVLYTSLTVIIGFSVMNFAYLTTYHTFSRMICVAMAYALLGDLIFLPALLRHFDRRVFTGSAA